MKYQLCILLAMCTIHLRAQTWISLADSANNARGTDIEVLVSDVSQYLFKVTINGFYKKDTVVGDATYNQLYINEYETLNEVGCPELPVVNQLIGLPKGTCGKVTVSNITWENLNGYTVYPSQFHLKGTETVYGFSKSTNLYNSKSYFPTESHCLGDISDWGGLKMCNLILYPFRYNPSTSQLRVMKEFTVKVDFMDFDKRDSEESGTNVLVNKKHYSHILSNYSDALIESYNPTSFSSVENNNTRGTVQHYNLLVISAPQYKNNALLAHYLTMKAKQGFACKVVSTNSIGYTPTLIKNYIRNQRENYGIEYVLFIGNHSDIPAYSWPFSMSTNENDMTLSDYWYGCMGNDNDYVAEVAVGRFCVSNVPELHNVINKHLSYSAPNNSANNWPHKVLLVAHREGVEEANLYEFKDCLEDIRMKYNEYTEFLLQYGTDPNVNNDSVVKYINQGVGIVIYRGHGFSGEWKYDWSYDNWAFDSTQVNKLNCPIINPVVFSIACLNSRISESPCLMESFTTNESAAVAFWGATEETYSRENNKLTDMIFKNLYKNNAYRLGDINLLSQVEAVNTPNGIDCFKANAMAYMIGGDPTLGLWTDNPMYFPSENIEVIQNKDSVTVSVAYNGLCDISLCSMKDLGLSYFKKVEGARTYTFTGVDVPCYINVNKHNYIPYTFNGNVTVNSKVLDNKSALVGNNITVGGTTITDGGTLTINANNTVTLNANFSCELGGTLIIE